MSDLGAGFDVEASVTRPKLSGVSLTAVPPGVSLLAVSAFRLARTLKAAAARELGRGETLGLVSWRVLVGLSTVPSATQKELVEFTRTQQAQLSRVLKDMESRDLIVSKQAPQDGRTKVFSMTALGRKRYEEKIPDASRFAAAIDKALSAEEQTVFLDMCERISRASELTPEKPNKNNHKKPTVSSVEEHS